MRFIQVFLTVGLTTGFIYAIIAHLFIKQLRIDRDRLEAFLEWIVARPNLPIIQLIVPSMYHTYTFVYGRSARRRLRASFGIGISITIGVMIYLIVSFHGLDGATIEQLQDLEQSVDPWLHAIATEDRNKEAWQRSQEIRLASTWGGTAPAHQDSLSVAIREHQFEFDAKLTEAISHHPNARQLGVARFIRGHYLDRRSTMRRLGNYYLAFVGLVIFNLLVDFLAASAVMSILSRLHRHPTLSSLLLSTAALVIVSSVLLGIAFTSYCMFVSGFTTLFQTMLALVFFTVFCFIFPTFISIMGIVQCKNRTVGTIVGSLALCIPSVLIMFLMGLVVTGPMWQGIINASSGVIRTSGLLLPFNRIALVLASSTLVPLSICVICLLSMGALKVVSEPLRETMASFVGFAVTEGGTTHIGAFVALLTFITALISAIVAQL
jgi:hypothetical protein